MPFALFERRADGTARSAPLRPQVHQDWKRGGHRDLFEVVVAGLGDPRQHRSAFAALGSSRGARRHPVLRPALLAANGIRSSRCHPAPLRLLGGGLQRLHRSRRAERSIASMAGRSLPRPITLRARPNPAAAWIQHRICRTSAARARAISRRTSGSTLGYCGSISARALTRTAAVARRVNHL